MEGKNTINFLVCFNAEVYSFRRQTHFIITAHIFYFQGNRKTTFARERYFLLEFGLIIKYKKFGAECLVKFFMRVRFFYFSNKLVLL